MSNINYRPEIDGLRAISVIGVLLYHAGLGFPGGYIGVDVFFVISGFLITSIIAKDLDRGTFSFTEFWTRRIRRIMPAVSCLVAVVLIAGFLILDPTSFKDLAESAFATSTMWSNFFFLNASDGYFHTDTELMPLLHTWSLAVEEQFYLFLPVLLFLLFKYIRRRAFLLLFLIAAASFGLSVVITHTDQSQSFYLLHTRTWELLAGALLALSKHAINLKRPVSELLSAVGLALVFIPMFMLNSNSSFPGLNALAPVAGAVAFIAGAHNHKTIASRVTSSRPMVFIGLISYSLYLWHWPLFAFSRHILVNPDGLALKLALLAASLVLATLSWRFVETPFRGKNFLKSHASAIRFGIAVTVGLCIVTATINLSKGFPRRLEKYAALFHDMDAHGEEYKNKGNGIVLGDRNKKTPDFILWGDSHAMMIASEMDHAASAYGLKGIAYISTARIPVTNLRRPHYERDMINYNRKVFDQILSSNVKRLILVSRWSANLNDETGKRLVSDSTNNKAETSLTDASESLERQLRNMLDVCRSKGIKVYIIKQAPETTDDQTARHFYIRKRYAALNPGTPGRFTITRMEHDANAASFDRILRSLKQDEYLSILDPAPPFFHNEQDRLEAYGEERSYYRDNNHLTDYGVKKFMDPVIDTTLQEISASEPAKDH